MARRSTPQPPRTNGYAWGPERVRLGLSMSQLSDLSGVSKAVLSLVESGRLIPTGAHYDAVNAALEKVRRRRLAVGTDGQVLALDHREPAGMRWASLPDDLKAEDDEA